MLVDFKSNKQQIINRYENGESTTKIAKEYQINSGTVYYYLEQWNAKMRPKRKKVANILNQASIDIINMYDKQNICMNKIAKQYKVSIPSIIKILRKNGYDTSKFSSQRDDPLVDHFDEILQLYNSGISANAISKQFNSSTSSVYMMLKRRGIEMRDNRQYNVDYTFFDKIDSPIKAYILGWFYSDGTVNTGGKMRIQIQQSDKYILEQIKDILKYDGPIYDVPPPKKFPNRKPQSCLCIQHKIMSIKLIELGCMSKKSLILKFPTNEQVPQHLIWHFLRGVFDGDGSISSYQSSITSSTLFNKELSILLDSYNINYGIYHKKKKKETSSIMTTNLDDTKKFLNLIYKDAEIYLLRKYNKYVKLPLKKKINQYG